VYGEIVLRAQREQQNLDDALNDRSQDRKPNKEILDHSRKRQIVLELLTMREELEEVGCAPRVCNAAR